MAPEPFPRLRQQLSKSGRPLIGQGQGDKRFPGEETFTLDSGAEIPLQPLLARREGGGQELKIIGSQLLGDAQRIHRRQNRLRTKLLFSLYGSRSPGVGRSALACRFTPGAGFCLPGRAQPARAS